MLSLTASNLPAGQDRRPQAKDGAPRRPRAPPGRPEARTGKHHNCTKVQRGVDSKR